MTATISVVNFVTLDGVMQSVLFPDEDREGGFGHGGRVSDFDDAEVNALMGETRTAAAAMLLGRKTYGGFALPPAVVARRRGRERLAVGVADLHGHVGERHAGLVGDETAGRVRQ